nr:hypothetical protein GCM10020092_103770 [Actinoplanes digitatis]
MAKPSEIDEPTREYPEVEDQPTPAPEPRTGMGGFARVLIFTGVVFALIVAMCLGLRAVNVLPGFDNPFSDKTTDRSQPVLLQSMRDLSRYVAADGTFQVIVDLQENRENIPDFLLNKRTLFVGSGTVEEYVDFGQLAEGAVKVDNNDKSVTIELPPRRSRVRRPSTWSAATSSPRSAACSIASATRSAATPASSSGSTSWRSSASPRRPGPVGWTSVPGTTPQRCCRACSPAWATPR